MLCGLLDYYGISESVIRLQLNGRLAEAVGFFKFNGVPCFGRCRLPVAQTVIEELSDCAINTRTLGGTLSLDFDPDEVADNLRRERYLSAKHHSALSDFAFRGARVLYYGLRPMLPVGLRKYAQRARASRWEDVAFPKWPVDISVDLLFEHLLVLMMEAAGVDRLPFIWFWPEGHGAAAILTHDVETTAGRDFCSRLMDLNESYGIRSSFQVVPEERYAVPDSFLDEIRKRNFEINIHDLNHDGSLFWEKQEFIRRASKINAYAKQFGAKGFRSAVLYRNLDWFDALDFLYDMSVPNSAPLDPQRGGCCSVMPYLLGDLVELPLTTTQDYSLFHVLGRYDMELWARQIDSVLARNGLLSFLVHPDYVIGSRAQATYHRLLERIQRCIEENVCWLALPRDVAEWWKLRRGMKLVKNKTQWEICGEGADRARVAWATAHNGELIYAVEGERKTLPLIQ